MVRVGSTEEVTSQEDLRGGRISPLLNAFRSPSGTVLPLLSVPDGTRAGYQLQAALGPLAQEFETGAQRQQPKVGTSRAGQPHQQNRLEKNTGAHLRRERKGRGYQERTRNGKTRSSWQHILSLQDTPRA